MPEDKTPSDILAELANVPFPNAAYVEAMKRVIDVQKQMLDGFQSNLDKWFERRREGAEATITMLSELNGSTDPGHRADAWQRWASGAMARIMEDVQTQYDLMSRITGKLATTDEAGQAEIPEPVAPEPVADNKVIRPEFKGGKAARRPRGKAPKSK
jgi:hypothetical protein